MNLDSEGWRIVTRTKVMGGLEDVNMTGHLLLVASSSSASTSCLVSSGVRSARMAGEGGSGGQATARNLDVYYTFKRIK